MLAAAAPAANGPFHCIAESEGDAGEARSLPDLADQAGPLDEASAKAQAQAAVNQRTATSLLADAERRLADTHAASAAVFQRAAKDAFDKGALMWRQREGLLCNLACRLECGATASWPALLAKSCARSPPACF